LNTTIYSGEKIAIIGRNGSGKSSLLAMLAGTLAPSEGQLIILAGLRVVLVPQIIHDNHDLSGAERFHAALTTALSQNPDVLLLDEPTNHLDKRNRTTLMRMLSRFSGTLLMVSHDVELLRHQVNKLWRIDHEKIQIFSGSYDDYQRELLKNRTILEYTLSQLKREKQNLHQALMQEQKRAKHSRAQGEKHIKQRKWPTVVSAAKAGRAETTSGRKHRAMDDKKQELTLQLASRYVPETINPHFMLSNRDIGAQTLVTVIDGSIGYQTPVIKDIHLQVTTTDRIAIVGDNASGKSTLLKALMGDSAVKREGQWFTPAFSQIGYLDQHYQGLPPDKTVLAVISEVMPHATHTKLREHLNRFLFRKNAEVEALIDNLSGGERARLSLAVIAAQTPTLLILDEVTNNLDLETRMHVIQVLQAYPGAMVICSHDEDFLTQVGITHRYVVEKDI
jgi:ATPase subunit of ABC transporter with duplicated ATPase domains